MGHDCTYCKHFIKNWICIQFSSNYGSGTYLISLRLKILELGHSDFRVRYGTHMGKNIQFTFTCCVNVVLDNLNHL